jgi:predicted flap endonuclease-1-like 5' DNA nuclease
VASIDYIEGIGTVSARKLRKSGVRTTEALLKRAGTKRGRKELSEATKLAERSILEWVNRADLMRVKGIGSEYSDLLEAAGVDTVKELRRRNPDALLAKMAQLNDEKRLVRRLPTPGMVGAWVDHAKSLDAAVTH